MRMISSKPTTLALLAMATMAATVSGSGALYAQELPSARTASDPRDTVTVLGSIPADLSGMAEGPKVEGIISARRGSKMQITSDDGTNTLVDVSAATDIKRVGGFLGINRTPLAADSLLTGLPVEIETVQWGEGLIASAIRFKKDDLQTASMIRGGTQQRFAEQGAAIEENAAATEALRGRVANIDQYNVKGVTNVYFDTGKWNLTPAAERELCAAASQADAMDNALLLVVGYTDSTGSQDFNQVLSERRAGRVVNFLQQQCRWAPYRMLTPTGMAESDPAADNTTAAGKAQNRRVAVNILVSKAIDGI